LVRDEGRITWGDPMSQTGEGQTKAGGEKEGTEEKAIPEGFVVEMKFPPPATTIPAPTIVGPYLENGMASAEKTGWNGSFHPGTNQGPGSRLFQITRATQNVVFVIDRSLSMGLSGALNVAGRELLISLGEIPAQARFQVILYNRRAEPLCIGGITSLLPASAENRQEAARLLEGLRAEGATDHLAALRRALLLNPDTIFFVTDADTLTKEQVQTITRLNRGQAAIHAVELRDGVPGTEDPPLRQLAQLNHGTHRIVPIR
jgi:hypothetical protein